MKWVNAEIINKKDLEELAHKQKEEFSMNLTKHMMDADQMLLKLAWHFDDFRVRGLPHDKQNDDIVDLAKSLHATRKKIMDYVDNYRSGSELPEVKK